MKPQKTQAHLAAKSFRIGVGAGITDDGVMDAVVFAFEDWDFTTSPGPGGDDPLVMVVPTTIESLRALGKAAYEIARFLETGEAPANARPME